MYDGGELVGCPVSVYVLCPADSYCLAPIAFSPLAGSVFLGKLLELYDFHFLSCKLGLRYLLRSVAVKIERAYCPA